MTREEKLYREKTRELALATKDCEEGKVDSRAVARLARECREYRLRHGIKRKGDPR